MDLLSYDACKQKAEAARKRALEARDASTAEEHRQIAALWEELSAAMEKHGVPGKAG